MKRRWMPSPALILSATALFVALGGTAVAYQLGRNSVHSRNIAPNAVRSGDLGAVKLRSGKLSRSDAAAGDGLFTDSAGSARCRRGEQLITGGVRYRGVLDTAGVDGLRATVLDSGPVGNPPGWKATISSDLGLATRSDFTIFAYCLVE